MKFDIFDVARRLKKEFGDRAEVLLVNDEYGFQVSLTVFHGRQFHHSQFLITEDDVKDELVGVFNIKFNQAINQLHALLAKY